jgi:hypothetical protein
LDFSTTVSFDAKEVMEDLPPQADQLADMKVEAKVTADIPEQRLKIAVAFGDPDTEQLPQTEMPMSAMPISVSNLKGSVVMTFDGPKGQAGIQVQLSADAGVASALYTGCTEVHFDSALIPPLPDSETLKQQYIPQADMMAQQTPHVMADGVAYYADGNMVLGLRASDGTPVGVWSFGQSVPIQEAADMSKEVPPAVKFGSWGAAEKFEQVVCSGGTDREQLLASPHVQRALLVAERVVTRLVDAAPLRPLTSHISRQMPQVLRRAAAAPSCTSTGLLGDGEMPAIGMTDTGPAQLDAVGILAMCAVSAVVGAGIAAGVALRVGRKSAREPVYLEIS